MKFHRLVTVLSILCVVPQVLAFYNNHCNLARVTAFVIREHLSTISTTAVITEHSIKSESAVVHRFLLDFILARLENKVAIQLHIGDQPWNVYVLLIDSVEAFKMVSWKFQTDIYERHFFFLIVLTEFPEKFESVLNEIFNLCYTFNVINVNLIVDHPQLGVSLFTYKLFTEDKCRVVQPLLTYKFSEGFGNLRPFFFPRRFLNFHKCPFRVAVRFVPPLVIFKGNTSDPKPTGDWENLSGLEGMILKYLATTLNFTIQLLPFTNERSYVANSTGYGCFAELMNNRADLVLGGFSASDPNRGFISPTLPYHSTPYVFVVRGEHQLGSMARLGRPFSLGVWLTVGFFIIAALISIQAARFMKYLVRDFVFGERNNAPTVYFLAVTLGYSIPTTPRRNFARFILLLWLFLTLVVRSAYQGALYDAIRMNNFGKLPSTFDDFIKLNYTIFMSTDLARLGVFPENQTVFMPSIFLDRFKLLEKTDGKYATVALRANYEHYKGMALGSDLVAINDVIYMYQLVLFLQKNSIYLHKFNILLRTLCYSGLVSRTSSYFTKDSKLIYKTSNNYRIRLSNARLKPMYEIYAGCMVVALMVFILELISIRFRKLRSFLELIN